MFFLYYLKRYRFLCSTMSSMFSMAHASRLSICGSRLLPLSDNVYSTRGGISGNASLSTNPSASSILRVVVSIFCEMSGMLRCSSLNLCVLFVSNVNSTSNDHLSPMRDSTFRMGQLGNREFLASVLFIIICVFSFIFVCVLFCYYTKVTIKGVIL